VRVPNPDGVLLAGHDLHRELAVARREAGAENVGKGLRKCAKQ
jgi:hypothetical protein